MIWLNWCSVIYFIVMWKWVRFVRYAHTNTLTQFPHSQWQTSTETDANTHRLMNVMQNAVSVDQNHNWMKRIWVECIYVYFSFVWPMVIKVWSLYIIQCTSFIVIMNQVALRILHWIPTSPFSHSTRLSIYYKLFS